MVCASAIDVACLSDIPTNVERDMIATSLPVYMTFIRDRNDPARPGYKQANLHLHNFLIPGSIRLGMRRINAVNHINDIVMRSVETFGFSPQLVAEICLLSVWLKWEICIDQQATLRYDP